MNYLTLPVFEKPLFSQSLPYMLPFGILQGEQLSLGFEFLIKVLSSPQPHGSQREKFYLIFVYLNLGENSLGIQHGFLHKAHTRLLVVD